MFGNEQTEKIEQFIFWLTITFFGSVIMDESVSVLENKLVKPSIKKHQLPPLKYDYTALEPYIDSRTMILHHDNHHATYVKKINTILEISPIYRHVLRYGCYVT